MDQIATTIMTYSERVRRVRDHMRAHLDEPLDLDRLAEIACYSRFHWHRVYRAMTGETAAQTVRRMRLNRAAHALVSSDMPIEAIAAQAGYGSQAAFGRAFMAAYGVPPATFRREGSHRELQAAMKEDNAMAFDVEIRSLEERPALGLVHAGPYREIGATFDRLFMLLGQFGLMPHVRGMGAAYLDDPGSVPEQDLRALAFAFVDQDGLEQGDLVPKRLGGGQHAILRYKGPYAAIQPAYDWLFGTWLPQSGRIARDAPCLELNLNSPADTPQAELLTEICLPVEG